MSKHYYTKADIGQNLDAEVESYICNEDKAHAIVHHSSGELIAEAFAKTRIGAIRMALAEARK